MDVLTILIAIVILIGFCVLYFIFNKRDSRKKSKLDDIDINLKQVCIIEAMRIFANSTSFWENTLNSEDLVPIFFKKNKSHYTALCECRILSNRAPGSRIMILGEYEEKSGMVITSIYFENFSNVSSNQIQCKDKSYHLRSPTTVLY